MIKTAQPMAGAPSRQDDEIAALFQDTDSTFFGLDLHQYFAIARRNIVWIALIVGLAVAGGTVLTLLTKPRYDATAQILIDTEADQIVEGTELRQQDETWDIDRFLQTQIDILTSRNLARRVVESGNLANDPRFYAAFGAEMPATSGAPGSNSPARVDDAASLLQSGLAASLPQGSRVVPIRMRTLDPVYSAKLANLYADGFIENNLAQKFARSAYARKFLSQQLDEVRARLENSERELNQYSRDAGLILTGNSGGGADGEGGGSSDSALSVTNSSLVQMNAAAGQATTERVAAQNAWQSVSREPTMSIPQVIADPTVQSLVQQRAAVQARLAEERARRLDDYPGVQALQAQVREYDSRIASAAAAIKRSVYVQYATALERERALKGNVETLREEALDEQDRGVRYNLLKRVTETDRSLFDSLLDRANQLNASAGAASNNISLVDSAQVPGAPATPNLPFNILVSFVLGLLVAALFVAMRDYLDTSIRSPADVESKLGLPLLGLIPRPNDQSLEESLADPKSGISESYRSLATNLRYATTTGWPERLMITSTGEGEGKSTTISALARDFALQGKRVLLIDADLRRPTLHRHYDLKDQPGLTEVLVGAARIEDVVQAAPTRNLSVMTALPIPPDPSLLLSGDAFDRVIARASELYDIVMIDAPPLLGLSDSVTMANSADGVLFAVDASRFHKGATRSALRRLTLVGAPILGVVLTKFDPSEADYYDYYGYKYYSYGYDSEATA